MGMPAKHIEDTETSNTSYDSQPGYGGMNQVTCGPAGLLYSLSNQLIQTYNQLQDLYREVAVAETSVQQQTIDAGAAASAAAAKQQAIGLWLQAGEAIAGGAINALTTYADSNSGKELDNQMTDIENQKKPLEDLAKLKKHDPINGPMVGDPLPANVTPQDVSARTTELKNGEYQYTGNPAHAKVVNQHAINKMSPAEFDKFKENLNNEISRKEKQINTLQSRRQVDQSTIDSKGKIFSQAASVVGKGLEGMTTAAAGQYQSTQQASSGVQQMAGSTADSSRGSIGQDYAKVSDAIAAARQGAQAYAQT